MYRICITALKTSMATRAYVIGNVMTCHKVNDSKDATPFVDRAVYPPNDVISLGFLIIVSDIGIYIYTYRTVQPNPNQLG